MGQYSLAEAKPIAAPSPTVAKGAYRLEEAKPLAQDGGIISSFVKGLKTFTPPLGAGSTTTKEGSKAEVLAIREKLLNDPLNYIADQVPFVSQIKKIVSDLKSGKDKGDIAAESVGELIAGAASSPPILMGGATPTTARARYGGGLAETPKPSKPVTAGGLMEMAKTGKNILQVLTSPNPSTKLSALGRLFETFASEVTPIEAPPAPTVVEAPPPVASGTPVRPPLRGKQFGTFNDPAAPPLPAGVQPSGPVRPPVAAAAPAEMPALQQITEWLASRDGGTASRFTDPVVSEAPITKQTLGDIMDRLMKNRKVPAEVPAATVPAEVPPAAVPEIVPPDAVATPQPATPAPSAAGKPVTAATLMEEATKPAGKKVPPFDWTDEAQYKEYQKALREDSNIYGNNRTSMADRVTRFMKKNGIEPTDSGIVKALEQSAEDIAVSPTTGLKRPSFNAADHEVLFDMIKDRMETPTAGAKPVASPPSTPPKPAPKPRNKGQNTVAETVAERNRKYDEVIEKRRDLVRSAEPDASLKLSPEYGNATQRLLSRFRETHPALADAAIDKAVQEASAIAKMDGASEIRSKHLAESLQYLDYDSSKAPLYAVTKPPQASLNRTTVGKLMGKVKK